MRDESIQLIADLIYQLDQIPLEELPEFKIHWLAAIREGGGSQQTVDQAAHIIDWVIREKQEGGVLV